jgi:hypothetical protein
MSDVTRRTFAAAAAAVVGGVALPAELAAQKQEDTLQSEFLMDIVLEAAMPLNLGLRRIVPLTGGTFSGPKLKGTALSGGADWILARADGVAVLNVRVTLRTDDDQLIYMTYDGIVYSPPNAKPGETYQRVTPRFETGSAKYQWLTRIVAVGVGRPPATKAVYRVYQIL